MATPYPEGMNSSQQILDLPIVSAGPEVNPASEWCQRWSPDRTHSWVHRSAGGFDRDRYRVIPIPDVLAKRYVLNHHYSGTYPAAVYRYGLYYDEGDRGEDLVGVAVFGVPTSAAVLTGAFPHLEPYRESLELSRFVLEGAPARSGLPSRAPANSETHFLAACLRNLAELGVRGVVSFADPVPRRINGTLTMPGHCGIAYSAGNALYAGRATARTLVVLPDGSVLNARATQKVRAQERGHEYVERRLCALGARAPKAGTRDFGGWITGALHEVGAVRLRHGGNHRYLFGTTPKERRMLRARVQRAPYPKQPDPEPTQVPA